MTETNAIGAGVGGDGYLQRPDGVGWPSAVLDLRVVDADGRELPPGEAGELQVRGTAVFRGYWRRPEGERGRLSRTAGSAPATWPASTRTASSTSSTGSRTSSSEAARTSAARGSRRRSTTTRQVVEAAVFGVPDARLGESSPPPW
jgi:acyl-CoA synthetase (AMP-forming)/AMP-acid ligase II